MVLLSLRGWGKAIGAGVVLLVLCLCAAQAAGPIVNNTPLDSTQAGSRESNLGDLVVDSVRGVSRDAQLAILPASELRATVVPAGRIDIQQIVNALRAPSDDSNTVVLLRLTGAQIRKAITHGLSREPTPYAGFLQVSGLRVAYVAGPDGPQISSLALAMSSAPIVDSQTYTVATTRLLADGALGYFEVWGKSEAQDTKTPFAKAVADFAASHSPLNYHVEGRITSQ